MGWRHTHILTLGTRKADEKKWQHHTGTKLVSSMARCLVRETCLLTDGHISLLQYVSFLSYQRPDESEKPFPPVPSTLSTFPAVTADDETAVREVSSPDETETSTKAPVDEEEQQSSAENDVDAAAVPTTADSPDSPSGEDVAEATVVEAVTEPAAVVNVTETFDQVVVPVETDEAPATGE